MMRFVNSSSKIHLEKGFSDTDMEARSAFIATLAVLHLRTALYIFAKSACTVTYLVCGRTLHFFCHMIGRLGYCI
jgi:hypothetical protein